MNCFLSFEGLRRAAIIDEHHLLNTYGNREVSADVVGRHSEVALHVATSGEWLLLAVSERVHAVLVVPDDILLRLVGDEQLFRERHVVIGEPEIAIGLLADEEPDLL